MRLALFLWASPARAALCAQQAAVEQIVDSARSRVVVPRVSLIHRQVRRCSSLGGPFCANLTLSRAPHAADGIFSRHLFSGGVASNDKLGLLSTQAQVEEYAKLTGQVLPKMPKAVNTLMAEASSGREFRLRVSAIPPWEPFVPPTFSEGLGTDLTWGGLWAATIDPKGEGFAVEAKVA